MTAEEKKEIKDKVPEHPKKEKREARNFQDIYDDIIRGVTKAGEEK